MTKFISKATLQEMKPKLEFDKGFDLRNVTRDGKDGVIAEFIGTGDFAAAWNERRQYEINAGRDQEPILYTPLYDVITDASLPEVVTIYRLGPAGVIFEEVLEGGEAKFASVASGTINVNIRQYAVALEYSKRLRIFNQLWNVSVVERQAGVAYNALLNHVHLSPILTATYAAANQTAAASGQGGLVQNMQRTLANAITNSATDATNPRRGPYALLINDADAFLVEEALRRRRQDGIDEISSFMSRIQTVISYNGWSGTRGSKTVSYAGVTANTGYLINLAYRDQDFRSFMKQPLDMAMGNPDVSRFIEEQAVWDTFFGVYANPTAAVEEVTFPTSGS